MEKLTLEEQNVILNPAKITKNKTGGHMFFLIAMMRDQVTAMALKSLLESEINGVITENNPKAVMEALDSGEVDIFIVDAEGLPDFTGEKLAETAKYIRSSTKVIVVTTEPEKMANKPYFDACFNKPFDFEEFSKKVNEFAREILL